VNPLTWYNRLKARRIVANQLRNGRYVFRNTQGETLASGSIRARRFSFELSPANVCRSGTVRRVELLNAAGYLAMVVEQKPFLISRKKSFAGKRIAFP